MSENPFDVSDAEARYAQKFIDEAAWSFGMKWLPNFSSEQGYINICIRFDFQSARTVTAADIEAIRSTIEDGVWGWDRTLIGTEHWNFHTSPAPVRIFGIGITDATTLESSPNGVPIYTGGAQAACPDPCFRFQMEKGKDGPADYSGCTLPDGSSPTDPTLDHFDFHVWYSDYGFGAAGRP
jgi:hypothetical protein